MKTTTSGKRKTGPVADRDAVHALATPGRVTANTLATIGAVASTDLRRHVLRSVLSNLGLNLARTSEALGLGGAPNVLRMIDSLGLREWYAAERRKRSDAL